MGQQEVYNFLKKHRSKWYTSKEIADKQEASHGSVITCLQKLRKSSAIDYKYPNKTSASRKNAYVYRFKI